MQREGRRNRGKEEGGAEDEDEEERREKERNHSPTLASWLNLCDSIF